MNWCEKSDGGKKRVMCIVTGNYGMISGASPREFFLWHGGGLTTLKEEGAEQP